MDAALPAKLRLVARDIKLSHTVFALPFALLAMALAAGSAGRLPTVTQVGLILACMVFARTVAMTVNRWADARFDAANPRTAGRALPSGRLTPRFMLAVAAASGLGFVAAAAGFYLADANPWPLVLSPLVLAYLAGYSFTKRFTSFCHIYLGSALALSPLAAAIAIEPAYLAHPAPWLLAALVAAWVAGFDIIYALQDVDVDRDAGLFSMPSRLGPGPALWISRGLHAAAAAAVITLAVVSPQLNALFAAAAAVTVALLVLEHALVWGSRQRHLHVAFFTLNGVISLLLGAAGIVDAVLRI